MWRGIAVLVVGTARLALAARIAVTVTRYGSEGDDKMHDTNARDGFHAGGDDDTIYGHAGALLGVPATTYWSAALETTPSSVAKAWTTSPGDGQDSAGPGPTGIETASHADPAPRPSASAWFRGPGPMAARAGCESRIS